MVAHRTDERKTRTYVHLTTQAIPIGTRIWVEGRAVRVIARRRIRLQNISEADAYRYGGIERLPDFGDNINYASWSDGLVSHNYPTAREAFAARWDALVARPSHHWARNPWVWLIDSEGRRVRP